MRLARPRPQVLTPIEELELAHAALAGGEPWFAWTTRAAAELRLAEASGDAARLERAGELAHLILLAYLEARRYTPSDRAAVLFLRWKGDPA